jgi:hypothetical protein
VQEALRSQDGIHIGDLLKHLESSEAQPAFIEQSVREVAKAHPEMTPIVIGCLSILERMKSAELRPLCRLIVNAPFDPDRDLIIAHAASLLAQQPHPEPVDALLLARAVDHRSEHVKLSTRRAISNLPSDIADQIHARASEFPEKPQLLMLKRLLRKEGVLSPLILPPLPGPTRPRQDSQEPPSHSPHSATRAKGARKDAPIFSTPIEKAQTSFGEAAKKAVDAQRHEPAQAPGLKDPHDPVPLLQPHRIRGYHLLTDSALSHIATLSKDYREIAAALAEYTLRHGPSRAREFSSKLVYGLTDPANTEKARFEDLARAWFSETD